MIPIPCQDFSEKQTRDHRDQWSVCSDRCLVGSGQRASRHLLCALTSFSLASIIAQMFAFTYIFGHEFQIPDCSGTGLDKGMAGRLPGFPHPTLSQRRVLSQRARTFTGHAPVSRLPWWTGCRGERHIRACAVGFALSPQQCYNACVDKRKASRSARHMTAGTHTRPSEQQQSARHQVVASRAVTHPEKHTTT